MPRGVALATRRENRSCISAALETAFVHTMLRATFLIFVACLLACVAACGDADSAAAGDRPLDAGPEGAGRFDAGVSLPVVDCPATASVTRCGDVDCAPADPFAAQSCRAICCTAQSQCGLSDGSGAGCIAQPRAGTGNCPVLAVVLGTETSQLQGCCAADGQCGAIAFGACVSGLKLGAEARACTASDDAGVDDAGAQDAGSAP